MLDEEEPGLIQNTLVIDIYEIGLTKAANPTASTLPHSLPLT